MRSNKKGYTLIEIIVCILLIVLIGTISIIVVKKNEKTNDDLKVEYVEKIKLDTAVYVEKNKESTLFSGLNSPEDYTYIQLKDLINLGILDENLYNPIFNNSSKNLGHSLVRVFLDSESNIDIEYPTVYEEKIREELPEDTPPEEIEDKVKDEIENTLKNVFIHIRENNENGNKFIIPDSKTMLNVIDSLVKDKTYKSSYYFYKALKEGDYNTYNDPGYYLADAAGNIINTTENDWCITKEKIYSDKKKKNWDNKWKYTYEICENSSIYNVYKNVNSEDNIRIVEMVDNDAPLLLSESDNREFVSGVDYFNALDNYYYGYLDFWAMYYYSQAFYVYDNYDGASYDVPDRLSSLNFTYDLLTQDLLLTDSNNNSRIYTVDVALSYNEQPYVYYDGPTYLYEYDIYYSNGEIYPFYDYIYAYDWDDNLEYTYYYLYDDYGNYYYPYDDTYIPTGNYTLSVEACDTYWYCDYQTYEIYVDYYYYEEPWYDDYYDDYYDYGYDDYYCGDACIIEQMQQNSEAWWGASPEEQDRLHEENEWLAGQLSGDTYYTDDGYWYYDDGSYVYGDDYYNDYYGYDYGYYDDYYGYDDYYYDYGYDCCW